MKHIFLILLALTSESAYSQQKIEIKPTDAATYSKQLKNLKASPAGKEVRFKGLDHPGFKIHKFLGEGGATVIFEATKIGTNERVALRIPLIRDAHDHPFLFNSNIKADHELKTFQTENQRRLPVMDLKEREIDFFATTRILRPGFKEFSDYKSYISKGKTDDPLFLRMEKDFGQFMRETADVEYFGDFHEGQIVWEDLGNGKGKWTVIDYGIESEKAISVSRTSKESYVDQLFYALKGESKAEATRLQEYRKNIKIAILQMRQVFPFSAVQNPSSLRPIKGPEGKVTGSSNIICEDGTDSQTGRAVRRTSGSPGRAGNALSMLFNVLQFIPEYNLFSNAVGVSCADARKKKGNMFCEWDQPLNPFNNVADCMVATEVFETGEMGSTAAGVKKEPVCGVTYRWVGLRLDDKKSREYMTDKGYFLKSGVKFTSQSGADFIKELKKKVPVTEAESLERITFPEGIKGG